MLIFDPITHTSRVQPGEKTILLVGRPGHLRDALMSLLCTLPDLRAINLAEDGSLALKSAGAHCPDLLLIAGSLPEPEIHRLLAQFQLEWPAMPCLVLVENSRQLRRAEQAGATRVLTARAPSHQLLAEIATLFKS